MTTSPGVGPSVRVAIVAGASRGVGRATALRLASSGYAVVVNYADDQRAADAVVDEVLDARGSAVSLRADVADELDVERLFLETKDMFGGVDVVVLAVIGPVPRGSVTEVALDELEALWQCHSRATLIVNREAARHVRDRGAIVNLTSSLVGSPRATFGVYTAARAAADAFTRVLAIELDHRQITVNSVALDVEAPCEPSRVAAAVVRLLTEEGRRITGQVIPVDHGISRGPWSDPGVSLV